MTVVEVDDLLLAAGRVGPAGRAIGVDATADMLATCRAAVTAAGADNVDLRAGEMLALPIGDGEADVVISNGVLNLAHDKRLAFEEIARVLRPGGRLQLADIVVESELDESIRRDPDLWAA